jgi:hypothetical protein
MSVKNLLKYAFSYYGPGVDKKGADVISKKEMTYEDVAKEIKELNRIIGWRGVQAIDRLDKMTDILKSFDSIVRKVDERLGNIERVIKIQVKPESYGREDIIKDVLERGKIVAAMMKKKKIVAKKKTKSKKS